MTHKQPDGLDPRRYRNRASAPVSRAFVRRDEANQHVVRERRVPLAQVRTNRRAPDENTGENASKRNVRIVTLPHEAVQPLTWAERHARYRSSQADSSAQGRLVPRTLAQTGHPARVEPQMRPRKSLPRQRTASRVPVRSGNARRGGGFWRRFLGFLFVLIVVAGGIGFALLSPTFRIQQLDISGTQNQKLVASIRRMGIQGQDIFLLDQSALVTRLEALPPVTTVSLGVQLPSTILVTVQERVPVLLWQVGKLTFGLAQDGTVIAPQSELSGTDHLALIVDARSVASHVRPGSRINATDIVFVEQVFEQVPGIEGVAPFSLQYVDTLTRGGRKFPANQAGSGSYMIVSANGWRAYLGDAQNSNSLANRLQELQQILTIARLKNLQIATIDLRFGLHAAYTLKA
jgi:hypothetical protein